MSALMAERQQKIEMIARIFAERMKELFRKLLRIVIENDTKEQQVSLSGEWITFNPSEWDLDMTVDVEVGLGAGQTIERISNLQRISEMQTAIVAGGGLGYIVTAENIYETGARITETLGFKNTDLFFTDPRGQKPPQPRPDPKMEKVKGDALKSEAEIKQKAAQLELDTLKEQNIARHRADELEMKERIQMEEIASRERAALGQQEATIEAAQISAAARESQPLEGAPA